MPLVVESAQHIGSRKEQQDRLGWKPVQGGVMAVLADGMGGLAGGAIAAEAAVSAFLAHEGPETPPAETLNAALFAAGAAVVQSARAHEQEGTMGTTLAAVHATDTELHWCAVGDSPVLFFRNGTLVPLSEPHTLQRHLDAGVKAGLLSPEEAESHPERRALTSFLGQERVAEIEANTEALPLAVGDRIVLCSDGLTDALPPETLTSLLTYTVPDATAQALVDAALSQKRPRQDNISVVVLSVVPPPPIPPASRTAEAWRFPLVALLAIVMLLGSAALLFSVMHRPAPAALPAVADSVNVVPVDSLPLLQTPEQERTLPPPTVLDTAR